MASRKLCLWLLFGLLTISCLCSVKALDLESAAQTAQKFYHDVHDDISTKVEGIKEFSKEQIPILHEAKEKVKHAENEMKKAITHKKDSFLKSVFLFPFKIVGWLLMQALSWAWTISEIFGIFFLLVILTSPSNPDLVMLEVVSRFKSLNTRISATFAEELLLLQNPSEGAEPRTERPEEHAASSAAATELLIDKIVRETMRWAGLIGFGQQVSLFRYPILGGLFFISGIWSLGVLIKRTYVPFLGLASACLILNSIMPTFISTISFWVLRRAADLGALALAIGITRHFSFDPYSKLQGKQAKIANAVSE